MGPVQGWSQPPGDGDDTADLVERVVRHDPESTAQPALGHGVQAVAVDHRRLVDPGIGVDRDLDGEATRLRRDLEVLVVADDADDRWLDELGSLCDALTSWTGNDTRPLALAPDELTSGRHAVLVEIGRDALVLFGDAALLRHARRLAAEAGAG